MDYTTLGRTGLRVSVAGLGTGGFSRVGIGQSEDHAVRIIRQALDLGVRLARAVPERSAEWLSFPLDDHAVRGLAERVVGWLGADPALRAQARAGLVGAVRERWSWEGVARGVIAAASGELDGLQEP